MKKFEEILNKTFQKERKEEKKQKKKMIVVNGII